MTEYNTFGNGFDPNEMPKIPEIKPARAAEPVETVTASGSEWEERKAALSPEQHRALEAFADFIEKAVDLIVSNIDKLVDSVLTLVREAQEAEKDEEGDADAEEG